MLGQSASGSTEHDGSRLGQLQERMRHLGGVTHGQGNLARVLPDGAHDHLAGVHAQADSPLLPCLRRQRSMSERRLSWMCNAASTARRA